MSEEKKYSNLIVSSLGYEPPMSPEFKEIYNKFARRILWIDDKLVPGAFQMNTSWYHSTPELDPIFDTHAHDSAEIIGFFGTDSEHPYELDADIRVIIDGEERILSGSSLIFIPPNLPHAMRILRVDKPVFHFSVVTEGNYNGAAYK